MIDREIDPVLLQARDTIEPLIEKYGFRLTTESIYYSAFGSAQIEYRHRSHWLRLNWDGKDRYLWLSGAISPDQHSHPGSTRWGPLDVPTNPPRTSQPLSPGAELDARISEMLTQIELFRASTAAV